MGRNSSGNRGGMKPGDIKLKSKKPNGVQSLIHIKDPQVYKATKSAISRYHAVLGVRQREVKLADLPKNVGGVHYTLDGKSESIYLNKRIFNKPMKEIEAIHKRGYNSGWSTQTNKPIAHTVTHELAHATWNNHLTGASQVAAGRDINKVYNKWLKDRRKTGYGKYAHTNVDEFFAETITKAVHGKADKYTRVLKYIVRKYKL